MPVTVTLELRLKPERFLRRATSCAERCKIPGRSTGTSVPTCLSIDDDEAHWLIYELWETVEHDEAYRKFRAGEGRLTELPPLLAAPPVKTRYVTTDI